MTNMATEQKAYSTAGEHRAHVAGVFQVTAAIKKILADQWVLGRNDVSVMVLRDLLLDLERSQATHIEAAQGLEMDERRGR
jgi:hypothetical protein